MNEHDDEVWREASRRARQLCEAAQASGQAVVNEGSVWLSTRRHLEAEGGHLPAQ